MRQPLNPAQSRVPTGNWAGYGFSKSTRQTSVTDKGLFCDPPPDLAAVKVNLERPQYFLESIPPSISIIERNKYSP